MGSLIRRRRAILLNQERLLPAEYQQVDYIMFSDWAFLQTVYTPIQGDEFEVKYMPTIITNQTQSLFWAGTGTYQLGVLGYISSNNGITNQMYYYKYFASGTAKSLYPLVEIDNWYTLTISANGVLNVNEYSVTSPYEQALDGNSTTLWIFRRRNGESGYEGKLKSFIIKNNNVLKMNLIPCIQLSTNIAGMYDTVSKTFLQNASSGGTIIPSTLDT